MPKENARLGIHHLDNFEWKALHYSVGGLNISLTLQIRSGRELIGLRSHPCSRLLHLDVSLSLKRFDQLLVLLNSAHESRKQNRHWRYR